MFLCFVSEIFFFKPCTFNISFFLVFFCISLCLHLTFSNSKAQLHFYKKRVLGTKLKPIGYKRLWLFFRRFWTHLQLWNITGLPRKCSEWPSCYRLRKGITTDGSPADLCKSLRSVKRKRMKEKVQCPIFSIPQDLSGPYGVLLRMLADAGVYSNYHPWVAVHLLVRVFPVWSPLKWLNVKIDELRSHTCCFTIGVRLELRLMQDWSRPIQKLLLQVI